MDWQSSEQRREADAVDTAEADAASEQERREAERHMTIFRVARLGNRSLEVEGLGVVRNISSGGMMIEARIPATIGQKIAVSMLDDQNVTGEVIWQQDGNIGIKFAEQVDVADILSRPASGPRGRKARLPRLPVDAAAGIEIAGKRHNIHLCDISQRGAKLQCTDRLTPNEQIWLKMGDRRPVRGTVRWHVGNHVGIEFHRLLGVDELAEWLPTQT